MSKIYSIILLVCCLDVSGMYIMNRPTDTTGNRIEDMSDIIVDDEIELRIRSLEPVGTEEFNIEAGDLRESLLEKQEILPPEGSVERKD